MPSYSFSESIITANQEWDFCQVQYGQEIAERSKEVWEDLVPYALMLTFGCLALAGLLAYAATYVCIWMVQLFRSLKLRDAPLNAVLIRGSWLAWELGT